MLVGQAEGEMTLELAMQTCPAVSLISKKGTYSLEQLDF